MIDKISVQKCVLCGACVNICPVSAISFENPYLDFDYPRINKDTCIHCNQCERVCPIIESKGRLDKEYPVAFAAKSTEESIRARSSSGGVFYELASRMLSDGGYVCGAVFDDEFHVKHIVSNNREDLIRMMGSKYSQSSMGYCYREIQSKLDAGQSVLFSGCPCQVAGLRTFLKKDYQRLVIAELICHGVPSDRMLQAYIKMREKKYGSKLKSLEFRNKAKGWHRSSVRMEFENNRVYIKQKTADAYVNGFLGGVTMKAACYQCPFRNFSAGSDIILGDFWGAEAELPEDDNKGTSAVIVETERGMEMLNKCNIVISPVQVETVVKYNKSLIQSAEQNNQRASFYSYAEKHGLESAIRRYLEESFFQRAKRSGRYLIRCAWYALRGRQKPLY